MDNITEKFLQEHGFQYDDYHHHHHKEYYFKCGKDMYVNVQLEPDGFCDVIVEIYETRGWLNHITSQQQLKDLVKALSGEDI